MQMMLFRPSAADKLTQMATGSDLSIPMATAAVTLGALRAPSVTKLFGLPRSWTRTQSVAKHLLRCRRHQSIGAVAVACGINKKYLLQVARSIGVKYRNRRPSPQEIRNAMRLVIRQGESFRSASAISGISRSALHRYVATMREEVTDTVVS